jgi:membrane protein
MESVAYVEKISVLMQRQWHFLKLLGARFIQDQGLPSTASLTYTTLLSLVPLMTVTLAVFSAFPVSERVAEQVQDFVFANFIPASGEVLQQYFQQFSQKASQLTGAGFAFLVVVALMLMANIDRAFNTIWRVKSKRSPLSMFIVYWSVLSLGPLLIGVSMAVTSYLVSIPLFSAAADTFGIGRRLLGFAPLLASAVAFTLLYAVVPNRRVPIRHAVAGGVLAAVLFELAKRGFAFYLTSFPTYEAIYGALVAVPIFLVWVYLSWLVTLLGAEFTCCLGIYRDEWSIAKSGVNRAGFVQAFRLLRRLWQAQHGGESLSVKLLSRELEGVSVEHVESLLQDLHKASLVLKTEGGDWALARDLSEVDLFELYRAGSFSFPRIRQPEGVEDEVERAFWKILQQVEMDQNRIMSVPLTDLFLAGSESDTSQAG